MRTKNIPIVLIAMVTTSAVDAQQLQLKTFRADKNSFHVASVLVTGEKDALLIDAQFTLSNAHRVVADIMDSGKNLIAIYISHGDPDYYFGLEIIVKAFPDVIVYATAPVIGHIKKSYQKKLETWGPRLGANGPQNVVMPRDLVGNSLELEGKKLQIMGLDGNSPDRSYVWIPSIKAIVGGVNVYDGLHLWIADAGTPEAREAWLDILNEMESLKPEIIIPAHALTDSNTQGSTTLEYSKNYLKAYQKEEPKAKDSGELMAAMKKLYPDAQLGIALELGAKVSKGEMKW